MSAGRHHRVRPGAARLGGYPATTPSGRSQGHVWTHEREHCDYCGTSMTSQRFRGDKCLDCRVRDGEAEVDENGDEVIEDWPRLDPGDDR